MRLSIRGAVVEMVTTVELARKCDVTKDYIMKLEARKTLPPANFRAPSIKTVTGKTVPGARVYSLALANLIAHVVKTQFPKNSEKWHPIREETKQTLRDLFAAEREGTLHLFKITEDARIEQQSVSGGKVAGKTH